jgi:hypothetical protein
VRGQNSEPGHYSCRGGAYQKARPKHQLKRKETIMPEKTKVDHLVDQYHRINRRYADIAKSEESLGANVAHLTEEEMNEYVQGTSRNARPYPQTA